MKTSKMTHGKVLGSLETRQDDMPRHISSHLGGLSFQVFLIWDPHCQASSSEKPFRLCEQEFVSANEPGQNLAGGLKGFRGGCKVAQMNQVKFD